MQATRSQTGRPEAVAAQPEVGQARRAPGMLLAGTPATIYGLCLALFLAAIGSATLFGNTVSVAQDSLAVSASIETARDALLRERFEDGRAGGDLPGSDSRGSDARGDLRARAADLQSATRDALRRLATTTGSTRGHLRIVDETLVQQALHAKAMDSLLSSVSVNELRALPAQVVRMRDQPLVRDVDDTFLAVERSLSAASREVLADARERAERLHTVQAVALIVGPVFFGLGLAVVAAAAGGMRQDQCRRQERVEREAVETCFRERRFRSLVQNATDLVLLCVASGRITFASPSAESGWGLAAHDVLGRPLADLLEPGDRGAVAEFVALAPPMPQPSAIRIETRLADADGQWRDADLVLSNLLSDPDVQAIACVARDIGHRNDRERSLHGLALYDAATGLPNGHLLQDRLNQALLRCRRRNAMVGLVLVGATSAQGEDAGGDDAALIGRLAGLHSALRSTDTVARLHDDCLAVVLEDVADEPALRLVADRMAAACGSPPDQLRADGFSPPKLGVALAMAAQTDAGTLLQHAQLALDRASPGRWFLFDPNLRERTLDRIELAGDLRAADFRIEMSLLYEPAVRLEDRGLVRFGAVVTWVHPVLGPVDAGALRTLAEDAGLAVPIGRWCLEEACRQLAAWNRQARLEPMLSVSLKIMAGHLSSPSLCADVAHAVGAAGIHPACLQLDLPEAGLLEDVEATIARLWSLREIGVRVTVDGLGSGFSAVPILRQLPIDGLAIDLAGGGTDRHDSMTKACALTALARSLPMDVSASGIIRQRRSSSFCRGAAGSARDDCSMGR